MLIRCSQLGYTLTPKIINRSLFSTNNYKVYYQNFYLKVPLSLKAEKDALVAKRAKAAHARGFFQKLAFKQSTDKLYRSLLLEFIIKNNLSFSLVNQLKTKKLFSFLLLNLKQISRRILIKDLQARYQIKEEQLH